MTFLRECAVGRVLDGIDDAARNQQGDVRRVDDRVAHVIAGWRRAPPTVAIEIASRRVTVVEVGARRPAARRSSAYASRAAAAPTRSCPALTGVNIPNPAVVADALRRALERAGHADRRAAPRSIVPDSIARVSLLPFEQLPARAGRPRPARSGGSCARATPFPIDEAQVTSLRRRSRTATATTLAAVVARRDVIARVRGRGRRRSASTPASSIWRASTS